VFKKFKDPISALTHMIGFFLAIPCAVLLIVQAARYATVWHVVSFSIFGGTLILLYLASTIYHMLPISERASEILRKLDHMMIFVLIAGTYTPICLVPLRGAWGWSILGLVWTFAIAGIILKAVWFKAPRWLSTTLYVTMGWVALIAIYPLVKTVPPIGVWLLFLGGVTYTIGAVIYAVKWPKLHFKWFGFHELFHLFVMGGSAFHIVMMFMMLRMG
jgi:hemolysin III